MIFKKILLLISIYSVSCYSMQQQSAVLEFDRETFVDAEGYWASDKDPKYDSYQGKYPFPKANEHPWQSKEEFLKKLAAIEATAGTLKFGEENPIHRVYKLSTRGHSFSRLEQGVQLGSEEFLYKMSANEKIRWTDVFGSYYIAKFNVKPSRQFYNFVMQFALENK